MLNFILRCCLIEFSRIFKTKALITVLILGPIIYGILYPQPYVKEQIRNIPLGVIDFDNSNASRQIIRNINASDTLAVAEKPTSLLEAKELLKQKKIYGIVVIPLDLERNLKKGQPESIPFYGDASYLLIYNNAATALTNVILSENNQINVNKKIAQKMDPSIAKNSSSTFIPNMIPLFNPQAGYATYVIPPAFILILHQLLFIGIMAYMALLNRDLSCFIKNDGDFSPLKKSMLIVIGRGLAYTIIYSIFYWLYFLLIYYVYKIPIIGSPFSLLIFSLLFILATVFFAQFLSTFLTSIDSVFLLYVPLSIILFFITGVSWPVSSIPNWILYLSQLIPAVVSIPISIEIGQMGASLSVVFNQLLILISLMLGYFILAIIRTHKLIKSSENNK